MTSYFDDAEREVGIVRSAVRDAGGKV